MNTESQVEQLKRRVLKLLKIDGITVNDISKTTGVPARTIWFWHLEHDDAQEALHQ